MSTPHAHEGGVDMQDRGFDKEDKTQRTPRRESINDEVEGNSKDEAGRLEYRLQKSQHSTQSTTSPLLDNLA